MDAHAHETRMMRHKGSVYRCLLLGGCVALVISSRQAQAQQQPFTIADPAATSSAFSFDSDVTHPAPTTIVPRITGPEQKHESLHDSATGAKIEEFGSAYFYANPLYGTNRLGNDGVGLQDHSGRSATINFVVARFGGPPQKLPRIEGIDPSPTQPDVALICYAMSADSGAFPDIPAAGVIDLAVHSMGRARITRIDVVPSPPASSAGARQALLRQVALALVHQGVHPAAILFHGRRLLSPGPAEHGAPVPGHVVSLVLMDGS